MSSQDLPLDRPDHDDPAADSTAGDSLSFDTSVAHPARIYNYWLGGKDNYQADREAAEQAIAVTPDILPGVRANRAFLRRAVEFVAGQGIRQFLDVGTGLPTADNTHEVAQEIAPESRVVYVDNDPIVLAHARALLTSTPQGATAYVDADARDTAKIIESAASVLDFSEPVAVMALMVLQYIPDSDNPQEIVSGLMDAMPSGSYLVISDTTTDIGDGASRIASKINPRMGPTRLTPRPQAQIAAYFDGLDMVEPGLVAMPEWRGEPNPHVVINAFAGVARKP
ncbi:MAG TPA: SAM-dependent methyltransferase [Streptosporangiaceae bacterium]